MWPTRVGPQGNEYPAVMPNSEEFPDEVPVADAIETVLIDAELDEPELDEFDR
jgi:hypothetical protein